MAKTPAQQEKGLMFREKLARRHGMYFPFPALRVAVFWMKNTMIPLDILFVRKDGRIAKIVPRAKPYDETFLSSDEPVASVLEIGGGESERLKIKAGDRLRLIASNP